MKLFDKILMFFAGTIFFTIVVIMFSGELSYAAPPRQPELKTVPENEIIVYSEDVDKIIENYFKNIQRNPEQMEEEQRLIDSEAPEEFETPKPPEPVSKQVKYFTHIVKKGESLWRISNQYQIPLYTISSLNGQKANKVIQPGDELLISNRAGVQITVKKGNTLSQIAKKYKISVSDIKEANALRSSEIRIGQKLFLPGAKPVQEIRYVVKNRFTAPIKGRLTSSYGKRVHPIYKKTHFHTGTDWAANLGSPFYAAAGGVVVFAGDGGSYGNMIIVKHKDGYMTIYAHASKLLVKKGQYVKAGQMIGKVGDTGTTTGAHLHFEVKKDNKRMDPQKALQEKIKYKVKV